MNVWLCPLALCHEARDPAMRVNMNRFMHSPCPPSTPALSHDLSYSSENERAIANGTDVSFYDMIKHNRKIECKCRIMEKKSVLKSEKKD